MTVIPLHPAHQHLPTSTPADALEANLGLLRKVVSSVRMPDEFREDAFQEAALAFLRLYPAFSPDRSTLATFMWPHLRGAVTHFLRANARHPISTDDQELIDSAIQFASPGLIDVDLAAFIRSRDDLDRQLIGHIYWADETLSGTARLMGVTRQSTHVRHARLLNAARDCLHPQSLSA